MATIVDVPCQRDLDWAAYRAELLASAADLHAAITCISCGHSYPGHYWGCAQTSAVPQSGPARLADLSDTQV